MSRSRCALGSVTAFGSVSWSAFKSALDDGRAGILVPPADAEALARAIGHLLEHPDRARVLGARAQQRAQAEYDVARMVARYAAVYRELLGDEPGMSEPVPEPFASRSYGTLT